MRLLHTSDWHLGKRLLERSLLDDQASALEGLAALLQREPFDLLVVAGDVFDQSIPSEEAVALLGRFLAGVRERLPTLPVVLIAGNHDSAARLSANAELIRGAGVHLRGDAERVDEPVSLTTASGEGVEVWCIPFLWPGALQQGDTVARTQSEALGFALERIRARADRGRTQVLVSHCFTQGGATSESERVLVGQATLVDPAIFADFDYVALGHLHRAQRVAPNARYSGALLAYSFSEAADEKVALSVEVAPRTEHRATALALPRRRALTRVAGTLDELLEARAFDAIADDYLQITLTHPQLSGQPMAALRKRFPHILQLVNPTAQLVASAGAASARSRRPPGQDLDADFAAFESSLYGDAVSAEVRAAFERLREATRGDAAGETAGEAAP